MFDWATMSSRRYLWRILVAAALVVTAVATVPAAAGATCYSSVPAAVSLPDSPADGDYGLAPEILGLYGSVDGTCNVGVNPSILYDLLVDGDGVAIFLDTDGNAATGDTSIGGMDRAVLTTGGFAGNSGPYLATWDGIQYSLAGAPLLVGVDAAGFVATIDQLAIPASTQIGVVVVALYSGIYDDYVDFAPEPPGIFRVPVGFSTTPPPPPPAPQPLQQQRTTKRRCTVPGLKGRTVAKARKRLRRARCKYKMHGRGRVYSQSPSAGTRTSGKVHAYARRRARKSSAAGASSSTALRAARRTLDRALERAAHERRTR